MKKTLLGVICVVFGFILGSIQSGWGIWVLPTDGVKNYASTSWTVGGALGEIYICYVVGSSESITINNQRTTNRTLEQLNSGLPQTAGVLKRSWFLLFNRCKWFSPDTDQDYHIDWGLPTGNEGFAMGFSLRVSH